MERLRDLEYLAWAHARYGRVRLDLASSGIPPAPASMLGEVAVDALEAPRRFAARIAARYGRPADEAVPVLGTSHGLYTVCVATLSPRDEVLVEAPAYEPLLRIPEGLGATVRRIERRREDGYALDPERVARELSERTRLVVLSSPHNPSGAVVEEATLREVGRLAAGVGALVLVDEVYRDFVEPTPWSARSAHSSIVAVSSFTKCYGLSWARAGWILASPDRAPGLHAAVRHTVGQIGTTPAAFGLAALAYLDDLTERANAIVADKRERVQAFVDQTPELSWARPPGGLFGLVHVEGAGDLRPAIERVCDAHGVLVAPGSFFGVPGAFRIGWTAPETKLAEGLSLLGQHLLRSGRAAQ